MRKGNDKLICRTDEFTFQYDCKATKKYHIDGAWHHSVSQFVELIEKQRNLLHDPEYATEISKAIEWWRKMSLYNIRNGRPALHWEIRS